MKNENIDRFLKADPNLELWLPGLAYQAAPLTEVYKFPNSVFSGLYVDICLNGILVIILTASMVPGT